MAIADLIDLLVPPVSVAMLPSKARQ